MADTGIKKLIHGSRSKSRTSSKTITDLSIAQLISNEEMKVIMILNKYIEGSGD